MQFWLWFWFDKLYILFGFIRGLLYVRRADKTRHSLHWFATQITSFARHTLSLNGTLIKCQYVHIISAFFLVALCFCFFDFVVFFSCMPLFPHCQLIDKLIPPGICFLAVLWRTLRTFSAAVFRCNLSPWWPVDVWDNWVIKRFAAGQCDFRFTRDPKRASLFSGRLRSMWVLFFGRDTSAT